MYDLQQVRESIRFCSLEADLTSKEEYEFYMKYALRTKADLLNEIRIAQKKKCQSVDTKSISAYNQRLSDLFDAFYEEINSHLIMEPLDNFWGYMVEIRETGITLKLMHLMILYDYVDNNILDWNKYSSAHYFAADDGFPLLEVPAKLLTLEEYGKLYGVEAGSVRQWIRRGKLRGTAKLGKEWRVSELTRKPERGYTSGFYSWKTELVDLPIEIPNIKYADALSLYRDEHTGEWVANLECYITGKGEIKTVLDVKSKEKLELYLISNPQVECINNYILTIQQKDGSQFEMMKLKREFD